MPKVVVNIKLKISGDLVEALYSMQPTRNNAQLTAALSSSPRSPVVSAQQMAAAHAHHPGFNSYTGQLAVTDAATNGQWTEGGFKL
jgi:hypothetical protein